MGSPKGGDEAWTLRTVVSRQPSSPGPGLVTAPRVLTVLPKLSKHRDPPQRACGAGRCPAQPSFLSQEQEGGG